MVKSWKFTFILTFVALLIKIFSFFPEKIEQYYSNGAFPFIAYFQRILTGFIPFSLGDVIYAGGVAWITIRLFKNVRKLFLKKITSASVINSVRRTLNLLLIIFILFYGLWGLNYYRQGIASQLNLPIQPYNSHELQRINFILIEKLNKERREMDKTIQWNSIPVMAVDAYGSSVTAFPFLKYRFPSIKSSLYGKALNYFGILGYYNPFSGEAQVNTRIPEFLIPFTTCHEIGHQLGYGTEDEANFVGYLAATSSSITAFRYSARLELYLYTNGQLSVRDSITAKANYFLLDTLVKKDLKEYKEFLKAHQNPLEPLFTSIYNRYLKANNQPKGIVTYNDVVALLIAYEKKFGKI